MTTARWRMPTPESRSQADPVSSAADRAREEEARAERSVATKENPLSDS